MEKEIKKPKTKWRSVIWLLGVSFIAVGLLLFCQFYYGDTLNENTTFYQNTHINGVDVSGMTRQEATDVVSSKMLAERDELKIVLTSGDREWTLNGSDFEAGGSIEGQVKQVMSYGRSGNVFAKKKVEDKIKQEGLNVNISYKEILGGIDQKIDEIVEDLEKEGAKVCFAPDQTEMFFVNDNAVIVDRSLLYEKIDSALQEAKYSKIEIPLSDLTPKLDKESMIKNIKLRSKFSTDYSNSSSDRKSNIKKALSAFNGMIVEPMQEVSFNQTTGPRTTETGYKKANIIVNGVYISGAGGGVCQASTTLYNALIRAGVEILQVNHHSLPASYVPLSFDAMVSEGFSDLVFKNTLDAPIYIKAYGDENKAYVEIYGTPLDEGEEYYRLKYPREGYESKGYLIHIKDGKSEEKLIRHDFYQAQSGIIVEGNETLGSGMTPANTVKLIPSQKVTSESEEVVRKRIEKLNPKEFQP